jgi:hypothetical protein
MAHRRIPARMKPKKIKLRPASSIAELFEPVLARSAPSVAPAATSLVPSVVLGAVVVGAVVVGAVVVVDSPYAMNPPRGSGAVGWVAVASAMSSPTISRVEATRPTQRSVRTERRL